MERHFGLGRGKLVEVRGAGSKIYVQDGYFSVNVYVDFIVDNTETKRTASYTYGKEYYTGLLIYSSKD